MLLLYFIKSKSENKNKSKSKSKVKVKVKVYFNFNLTKLVSIKTIEQRTNHSLKKDF